MHDTDRVVEAAAQAPDEGERALELVEDWLVSDAGHGYRATARIVASVLLLTGLAGSAASLGAYWLTVLLAPVLGSRIYKLTIVMHDCAHGTLFPTERVNLAVGRWCGALVGSDFEAFKRQHWLHHRCYGQPGDPQGPDYLGLMGASRKRLTWHLLRPLLGLNLVKLSQFGAERPAAETQSRELSWLVRVAFVQLFVATIATGLGQVWWMVFYYPTCAATFGLFFSQLRGFCEHIAIDGESETFVRTHLPNALDRFWFYDLDFNYHVEHHLYPGVPSCHLAALHAARVQRIHDDVMLSPSILATVRRRFAAA